MIRVLILAGIRLYREGLAQLLSRNPTVAIVAAIGDGRAALSELERWRPDIVLLDMATDEGYAIAQQLRQVAPAVGVIAIGIADSDAEVLACAEVGAAGYLTREGSLEELVDTVHRAAKGELVCSPRAAAALARRVAVLAAERDVRSAHIRLTRREREIVELLGQDLSNKDIAVRLRIEVATVKNHVHNIMEKLQIHRRADAARALGHRATTARATAALAELR